MPPKGLLAASGGQVASSPRQVPPPLNAGKSVFTLGNPFRLRSASVCQWPIDPMQSWNAGCVWGAVCRLQCRPRGVTCPQCPGSERSAEWLASCGGRARDPRFRCAGSATLLTAPGQFQSNGGQKWKPPLHSVLFIPAAVSATCRPPLQATMPLALAASAKRGVVPCLRLSDLIVACRGATPRVAASHTARPTL
jgi:hypothetical protein